jgi:hypothetical protein
VHLDGSVCEVDGEVADELAVIEEVPLDHVALVPEAEHELIEALCGVGLHDVPEDRPPPDIQHRLGDELGLFPHASAEPTAEDHNLHRR